TSKHEKYSIEGLKLARELKDTSAIVIFLNSKGLLASDSKQYEQSMQYYTEALKLEKAGEKQIMLATLFNNIGMVQNSLGKHDQALEYLFKSVETAHKLKDKRRKIMRTYKVSKEHFEKNFAFGVGNTYINIGTVYKNKKTYNKSIEYSNKGLEMMPNKRVFYQFQKVYNTLSQAHEGLNKTDLAFKYYKLYIGARDSLSSRNYERRLNKVVSIHTAEKKEKELAALRREADITKQRNRAINTALGGGLFLMLSLAGLMYKRYDDKRKSHNVLAEQNHEITAQNHEISAQRDQIAEKSEKLEFAYQNITDSIEYAQRIQEALLPSQEAIRKALPESMIMLKPRDKVSGDFYWFTQTGENETQKTVLAAVDCTGHGVPGAFMSMAGDAYLNQIVKQQGVTKPNEILFKLHKNIRQSLKQETTGNRDGMDISLVTIDHAQKTVNFAGAKNPLLYIQSGKLHLVKGDKHSIGGEQREDERSFTNHQISIDTDESTSFYLFSDGFQDQFGGSEGKKYMVSQFRDLLLSIHHLPMHTQKEHMEKAFSDWLGTDYEQLDDVLVMGFKV
ncbi:SpoIIE family protein phosphatase, partial [Microscilla marina]|uniref:SpoIIE family protein phosphatase n=1 Tax=Microscilla marina TaxID=1027 RepID=UPI0005D4726F